MVAAVLGFWLIFLLFLNQLMVRHSRRHAESPTNSVIARILILILASVFYFVILIGIVSN